MKVVGITCGVMKDLSRSKHYVNTDYVNAIIKAGALPLLIPVMNDDIYLEKVVDHIDALLVTGGEDVNPMVYHDSYHFLQGESNYERDMFDIDIIKKCAKANKPILGICRGLQIINVAFGGTLYQDIREISKDVYNHKQLEDKHNPIHYITNEKDSFLYKIFNEICAVNSFHHQAIKELGERLKVTSKCNDGVIEAIEHQSLPIYACQFHPEMMAEKNENMQMIFNQFVEAI